MWVWWVKLKTFSILKTFSRADRKDNMQLRQTDELSKKWEWKVSKGQICLEHNSFLHSIVFLQVDEWRNNRKYSSKHTRLPLNSPIRSMNTSGSRNINMSWQLFSFRMRRADIYNKEIRIKHNQVARASLWNGWCQRGRDLTNWKKRGTIVRRGSLREKRSGGLPWGKLLWRASWKQRRVTNCQKTLSLKNQTGCRGQSGSAAVNIFVPGTFHHLKLYETPNNTYKRMTLFKFLDLPYWLFFVLLFFS